MKSYTLIILLLIGSMSYGQTTEDYLNYHMIDYKAIKQSDWIQTNKVQTEMHIVEEQPVSLVIYRNKKWGNLYGEDQEFEILGTWEIRNNLLLLHYFKRERLPYECKVIKQTLDHMTITHLFNNEIFTVELGL